MQDVISVWQGVAMDTLKLHLGSPHPTPLPPAGCLPLKRSLGCFRDGLPTGLAACGSLLPSWTPHTICLHLYFSCSSNIENKAKQMFEKTLLDSHRHHISLLEFESKLGDI
jgi:hypothetical protein